MTLRVPVGAVGSGTVLTKLALYVGVYVNAFIAVLALGEVLARVFGVEKVAVSAALTLASLLY